MIESTAESEATIVSEKGHSLWNDAWHRLLKNKMAVFGLLYLGLLAAICVFLPLLANFDYANTDLLLGATPPSAQFWMGTDELGRDLFARLLYGSRISLAIGILATAVSVVIGTVYGAVAGYLGGKIDGFMMRVIDTLYALPFIFLVIILMVLFGRNIYLMFIALGSIQWLTMARIVRGQVVSLRNAEFVESAISIGLSTGAILRRHIIPNVLGPVIVYTTLTIPGVILEEAFLSFLGLGVQEPMSSWGTLISDGVSAMDSFPWLLIFPCATLVLTLMALNFLGDGLRDALDPRASKD